MLKHTKKLALPTALSAIAALLAACTSAPKPHDTLEMGVMLPFSGTKAEFAQSVREGMELAAEGINARADSPKKLSIVWADTKGDISETSSILQRFIKDDIKVIHAGFTRDVAYDLDAFGLLKDSLVNFLCAYPPAAVHSENSVRIFLNGAQECEIMAGLAKAQKGENKKLMIMGVNDALGKSCGGYLKFQTESPSIKILSDTFKDGEKNFDIFAEQISMQKIDFVMLYGYGDTAKAACESLAKSGYKGLFASNAGFGPSGANPAGGMEAFEVATAFSLGKLKNSEHLDFAEKYKKKYGKAPHWTAAYGYDSINLAWQAMSENAWDAKKARTSLLGKTFGGAAGKISIDKLGDSTSELELVKK